MSSFMTIKAKDLVTFRNLEVALADSEGDCDYTCFHISHLTGVRMDAAILEQM